MFGHTLRMLRTTAGISLRSLAKKIDVSPAYLSQVELGKLNPPTHDRITRIAETIGIPVSLLLEMSHRPNPDTIMLLRGHYGLNEFIKSAFDIGLEDRDLREINALMQKLGGGGFRKLIRYGLEHSSDFIKIGKGRLSPEARSSPAYHMSLSSLSNPQLVFKKLAFTEKSDLLRYMLEKISLTNNSFDLGQVYNDLISNEAEDSSGLGNGVALPHLFVNELDRTIIAVARVPEGIDFKALDKKAVFIVCLILSNPRSCQSHLNLLAHFARKFQRPMFVDDVLNANTKKNILSLLFDTDDTGVH